MKTACLLLAEGFEEVEALTPADYLRRADINVTIAGIAGRKVKGAHGIVVETDAGPEALERDYDAIVLPWRYAGRAQSRGEFRGTKPHKPPLCKRQTHRGHLRGARRGPPRRLRFASGEKIHRLSGDRGFGPGRAFCSRARRRGRQYHYFARPRHRGRVRGGNHRGSRKQPKGRRSRPACALEISWRTCQTHLVGGCLPRPA